MKAEKGTEMGAEIVWGRGRLVIAGNTWAAPSEGMPSLVLDWAWHPSLHSGAHPMVAGGVCGSHEISGLEHEGGVGWGGWRSQC